MAHEKWSQVKEIFDAVLQRKPEERAEFLVEACNGDNSVRLEVESLLSSFGRAEGFMQRPAVDGEQPTIKQETFTAGSDLGHYEIIRLLGVGGMGEVYLAKDQKLGREVAIKILNRKFENHESGLHRFIQEAKAASALNHPNILVIHDIGETDGAHYIVSEYVEGNTLRGHLEEKGLPLAEVLDVSIQIASALVAAHSARIVHRDIKPENIMLRPDGLAKVLDFGLAKLVEDKNRSLVGFDGETAKMNQTEKGIILGTVSYMSPEQAKGEKIDGRTDIFSLGVLMYEMIAGRTPFTSDSMSETFANLLNREPPPMSSFASGVPEELQRIVSKMLRKDRDDRYQTMKGLLGDLKELREWLTTESKLDRISSADRQKDTEDLTRTTGDVPTHTTESEDAAGSWHRRRFLLPVVAVLVLGILAFGWYWRQPAPAPFPQIKSLAVLPLKSLDSGESYLGLGIADAVIRRISQTGELTVRPTSAVRRYLTEDTDALTAAQQLTADAVLEGSVQRAEDRLRVSVNLLRTSDGASLWADSFDMRAADVFTIQDTVAQHVATRLRLQLDASQKESLTKRYTSNPEAYEYYLKGRATLEQQTTSIGDVHPTETAVGYFKKAVEQDPKYALAYASLAESYMWIANFNDPDNPAWVKLMQQALAQAESLDPQLAETHRVRFEYFFSKYGDWNLTQAALEARQALNLNPSVGHLELGTIYDHLGLDEASGLREYHRALEIDPTNTFAQARLVEAYRLYGKFEDAHRLNHRYFGHSDPQVLVGMGQFDEAESLLQESVKKRPGDVVNRSFLALVLALKGKHEDAEAAIPAILHEARNNRAYHHVTYNIASIYARNGKTGESVKWLRETASKGFPNYSSFARDPYLDRIRHAPEFIEFMAEMKEQHEKYRLEFQ